MSYWNYFDLSASVLGMNNEHTGDGSQTGWTNPEPDRCCQNIFHPVQGLQTSVSGPRVRVVTPVGYISIRGTLVMVRVPKLTCQTAICYHLPNCVVKDGWNWPIQQTTQLVLNLNKHFQEHLGFNLFIHYKTLNIYLVTQI